MPLDRFIYAEFKSEPLDQYPQNPQKAVFESEKPNIEDIEDIEHRVPNEKKDAEGGQPFSLEPLPGRFWLDPVDNGFLPAYKTVLDRKECRGHPQACPKCRLLMSDLETCLMGPGLDTDRGAQ